MSSAKKRDRKPAQRENCDNCGCPLSLSPKNRRYCCNDCRYEAQRGRGRVCRTKPHSNHIRTTVKNLLGERKSLYEHRIIVEKALARPLLPDEIVHHIDEDKQNNDISNLEILSGQAAHLHKHNYFLRERAAKQEREKQKAEETDFSEFGW